MFNWQTALREPTGTRATSLGFSATSHLANFIEEASTVYMAPEALAERGDASEQADVFSLGALAYHLFSGAPPARSFYELGDKLRRHQFIVKLHDQRDYQGRVCILMDRAGDKTLAQRLREEGRLHLELLERFGDDLLQIVDWLEQEGVPHRDIKPENLGVALMGKAEQLHLVLFDFSLADTPAENSDELSGAGGAHSRPPGPR